MNKVRFLNAASLIALTALLAARPAADAFAQQVQGVQSEAPSPQVNTDIPAVSPGGTSVATQTDCVITQLPTEESTKLSEAAAVSAEKAILAALGIVLESPESLTGVVAQLMDLRPDDRQLVLATMTASYPERALSIAQAVIGCECRSPIEDYASLVNLVVASAPAVYDEILNYALANCPEIALALIAPETGEIITTQVAPEEPTTGCI